MFESFQRGRDSANTPGTGLGLNITRTLARLMCGDVRLALQPDFGACFTLDVTTAVRAIPGQGKAENVKTEPQHMPLNNKKGAGWRGTHPFYCTASNAVGHDLEPCSVSSAKCLELCAIRNRAMGFGHTRQPLAGHERA